jgi:biotin synthase-related radical SAM superfamily protein
LAVYTYATQLRAVWISARSRAGTAAQPSEVFIRVDFPSVEQAKTFRERLIASGAIERGGMRMKTGPTVAEVDDATTY